MCHPGKEASSLCFQNGGHDGPGYHEVAPTAGQEALLGEKVEGSSPEAWEIVVDDVCAIYRNHVVGLCIECQVNPVSAASKGGCRMQLCFSFLQNLLLAQNAAGVSIAQQRVGIPSVVIRKGPSLEVYPFVINLVAGLPVNCK